MFFSTTESHGVITDADSVFVSLSRYPLQALLNAPHSIICRSRRCGRRRARTPSGGPDPFHPRVLGHARRAWGEVAGITVTAAALQSQAVTLTAAGKANVAKDAGIRQQSSWHPT